jgi:hypothetical protein
VGFGVGTGVKVAVADPVGVIVDVEDAVMDIVGVAVNVKVFVAVPVDTTADSVAVAVSIDAGAPGADAGLLFLHPKNKVIKRDINNTMT